MIPQDKSAAVTRGLRDAFGVSEFEEISTITKGHTNSLVFRIIVGGTPYLMKIIIRAEDPTRHYTCMKAAAEAGLAPKVWYANSDDKVCITDFVREESFPVSDALVRLPGVLGRLHALPPFSRAPFNTTCTFLLAQGSALDGFLQKVQQPHILPKAVSEELFDLYKEVAAVYPYDDAEMVSSHNDLFKPDNILFDGERVWLVDWEAAFLNDRYADLAVAAHQVVTNDAEERLFLEGYFGEAPTEYQQARFFIMQQLVHIFYTMGFLYMASHQASIDWSGTVPAFRDCQRRMRAGEFDIADPQVKIAYGRAHREQLLENVRHPRYREALGIVGERRAIA